MDKQKYFSYTSSYSIKEIILIFSDIDLKISALNDCSAEDFLTLHSYLKRYHKQADTISKNASQVFDIVAGKEHDIIQDKLNNLEEQLSYHVNEFEANVHKRIKTLEKILTELNLMFAPLKNFNQNILTLNFLVANLKLNIAYIDRDKFSLIDNEAKEISLLVKEIKSIFGLIDENISRLKNYSRLSIAKLRKIMKRNILNVDRILNQVNESIGILDTKHEQAALKIPELTLRTQNYLDNVGKIITNLQYQDIIRQKMEHVQRAHKEIISELHSLDNSDFDDEKILQERAKRFIQIRDIAKLQVAQLIHSNREYQNAIESITRKFNEISEDMSAVAELCSQFTSDETDGTDSYFREIDIKLRNIVNLLRILIATNQEFKNEVKLIYQTIEKKAHVLQSIQDIFKKVNLTVNLIIEKIKTNISEDDEVKDIIKQISLLTEDIRSNAEAAQVHYKKVIDLSNASIDINEVIKQLSHLTEDIKINAQEAQEHYKNVVDLSDQSFKNTEKVEEENLLHQNFITLSDRINDILDSLAVHHEKVERILTDNSLLSVEVSSEIKSAVEQVKYYDFFEKVIDEIINELNSIYNRLDVGTINFIKQTKKENLSGLIDDYTMETQRIIHNKIVENKGDEIFKEDLTKKDEDNIEFF